MGKNNHWPSDETVAAFLDGCASAAEVESVLAVAKRDAKLREYLSIAGGTAPSIPMLAEVAAGRSDNLCSIRCEQYVLQCFGITASEEELACKSESRHWLKRGGTPLFRIGSICADYGLSVSRNYNAQLDDIRSAIAEGYQVIVAVDGGEIDGDPMAEAVEDEFVGKIPDHAVVVLSVADDVVCYDPFNGETPKVIPEGRFLGAWEDSNNFMVKVNTKEAVARSYRPSPLDLSDVSLPGELTELTEAIAENTHEVWSQNRLMEGWTFGPERDDANLKHPDLLPYSDLTEGEKEYDRATAMNAIKLIVKLGYKIEKCI